MQLRTLIILSIGFAMGCSRDTPTKPQAKGGLVAPITQTTPVKSIAPDKEGTKGEPVASPERAVSLTLNVIAVPSMVTPLNELGRRYSEAHPGVTVLVSGLDLVDAIRQIGGDSSVDIVVTEGMTAMEVARPTGIIDWATLSILTHVPLTVTLAESRVDAIRSIDALDQEGVRVGLADPRTTAGGIAAKRLLRRLNLGKNLQERVLPTGAVTALRENVVDAYIGWGILNTKSHTLTLPASVRELLPIPGAVVSRSENASQARSFLEYTQSDSARDVWLGIQSVPQPGPNAPVLPTVLPMALPSPRYWAGAAGLEDRILLVGGRMGAEDLNVLTLCEPERTRCQDAKARLPTGRHGVATVALNTTSVLIAGGLAGEVAHDEVLLFNVIDDRLDPQNFRLPRGLGRSAVIQVGEAVYLFGGRGANDQRLDSVIQLDVGHARCDELDTRLPSPRSDMAAALTADGQVLLLGGDGPHGPMADIVRFDPEKMVLARTAMRLPGPVADMTAIPSDDGWLLLGGRRPRSLRDEVDHFRADGTTRRLGQRLPFAVSGASIVAMGGYVYVLGGMTAKRIENRMVRWPW